MEFTLENGEHTMYTKLCDIVLEFWGSSGEWCRQQHVCRVVQGLVQDLILGMEWLNHINPTIDCMSRTMQVQGLSIQGCDCGTQVEVELCSWKVMVSTAKYTGNSMFLCMLNKSGKVLVVHKECPATHDIVGPALCYAAATNEIKEVAIPDPRLTQLCNEFVDVFAEAGMPPDRSVTHDIVLQEGVAPYKPRVHRMSPAELAEVQRQPEEFLEKGRIRPSTSPYGAPIFFVRKADGILRMCIDYRALNKQTTKYHYPIPRIDNLLDRLLIARYFSKLDLSQGYHQVAIIPGHEHKIAFISSYGLYEFTVLPIGLCNAPSTFYRLKNIVFRVHLDRFVLVYLDDILVYSPTMDEHVAHLMTMFEKLYGNKMYAKKNKFTFGVTYVGYLGHVTGNVEVRADQDKVSTIIERPVPESVKHVQQFMGFANYYYKYIAHVATLAMPLMDLL